MPRKNESSTPNGTPESVADALQAQNQTGVNATMIDQTSTPVATAENVTTESATVADAPKTEKTESIKIANAQYAADQLGIKIPAIRALVHKGKLATQTIDMPDFGIFGQIIVTPESIAAYKLAQASATPGKRGGGKSRTTVNYKLSIPRAEIENVLAALQAQFGIVAVLASAPRKPKTDGDATPVASTPATENATPVA